MRLPPFALHRPATIAEALELRRSLGDGAALYAGGTELILLMKLGLSTYEHLIDLKTVPELREIRELARGGIEFGATVTHRNLEASPLVQRLIPGYADMARRVANLRVRNAGTVGGNLCFADPHSDPATFLHALGADVVCVSAAGRRSVPVGEFLQGEFRTALRDDELVASVRVPGSLPGARVTHGKIAFRERPAATVTCVLSVSGGVVAEARIAVGSVGAAPIRVTAAEGALAGMAAVPPNGMIDEAAELAAAAVSPVADANGSPEYKRQLVRVLVRRGLREALTPAAA
jgi:aerobic carbon-monoxide dehydrogenase medium subunit